MPTSWRLVRPVVLSVLIAAMLVPLGLSPAAAQDSEGDEPVPVVIQGSNELEDLVIALRDAYVEQNPDADVQIDPRGGQSTAFEALCNGEVDVVMSTAPISDAQLDACSNNEQAFVETALAYEAIVLLASPEAALTCLDPQAVNDAWVFGAEAEVDWTVFGAAGVETPVVFYGPDAVFPASVLFSSLVAGGKLRDGITVIDDPAALAEKVLEEGSSALGYMTLADFESLETDLVALQLQNPAGDCIAVSPETIADGSYPLARTDYLYVNAESATTEAVQSLMQFVLEDENGARALAPAQGYTLATDDAYAFGLSNLMTANTGRTFTRPATPVTIDSTVAGTVSVAGTVMLRDVTDTLVDEFTAQYSAAEVTVSYDGNTAGWAAFCAGESDVLQTTAAPTDEELALCADNGVDPYQLDLGYEALVVAVPSSNDWLECLDSDTAAAMFRMGSDDSPAAMTWQDVNADWPDEALLLVVPPRNTGETDFLVFNAIGELSFALRHDTTEDRDPVYRAEGVANTTNGLTYLWWSDLQEADADVRLVAVDGGDGCVAPDADTIMDGSYALGFPVRYYVSQAAFDNNFVRAFLWQMFSNAALEDYAKLGNLGLDVDALTLVQREAVYDMLEAYEAQASE